MKKHKVYYISGDKYVLITGAGWRQEVQQLIDVTAVLAWSRH